MTIVLCHQPKKIPVSKKRRRPVRVKHMFFCCVQLWKRLYFFKNCILSTWNALFFQKNRALSHETHTFRMRLPVPSGPRRPTNCLIKRTGQASGKILYGPCFFSPTAAEAAQTWPLSPRVGARMWPWALHPGTHGAHQGDPGVGAPCLSRASNLPPCGGSSLTQDKREEAIYIYIYIYWENIRKS